MAEITGLGPRLFQEWAKKNAPGLYRAPRIEGPTNFTGAREYLAAAGQPLPETPSAAPLSTPPRLDTPTTFPASGIPVVAPTTAPMEASSPVEPGPSLTDRFSAGLSRVGEGLKDPARMGLLTAGLSMMATPPRAVPYSNAEIIGQAGLTGVKFYEQALEAKRKDEMMKETAEERTLTREDRREANQNRAQYYRDSAETRRLTAESLAEARKATAEENKVLDVPIDPAVAKYYGVDPKMTVRTFNKMQSGLTAMAKPEKETKPDAFTKWYESYGEAGPTRKDLEDWHRSPGSGAGGDSGPGKVGAIGQVNRELVAMYLPHAKEGLTSKGPAGMEEYKGMVAMFQTTDQFGGTVNDARLRESLSSDQRKEYDFVKQKAQDYSRKMTPANAVAKAQEDWKAKNPPKKADTGQRYNEFKSVYEEIRASTLPSDQKKAKLKELTDYARSQGLIQ